MGLVAFNPPKNYPHKEVIIWASFGGAHWKFFFSLSLPAPDPSYPLTRGASRSPPRLLLFPTPNRTAGLQQLRATLRPVTALWWLLLGGSRSWGRKRWRLPWQIVVGGRQRRSEARELGRRSTRPAYPAHQHGVPWQRRPTRTTSPSTEGTKHPRRP